MPQLKLSLDYQSAETGGDADLGTPGPASTGTMPPPRPQQVDWQMAIRCAVMVAGVAGILSIIATRIEILSPLSTLWIMSCSLITLGLYQKRRPTAWMDVSTGARIGLLAGLCAMVGVAIPMAVLGVIARFVLHSTAVFDAQMAVQIETVQKTMQQQTGGPVPADLLRFVNSPEFRGGMTITGTALIACILLVMSAVGGAFAGLVGMRRKTVA